MKQTTPHKHPLDAAIWLVDRGLIMRTNNVTLPSLPYFLTEQVGLYADNWLPNCNDDVAEQCSSDGWEDIEEDKFDIFRKVRS